jgi:hypothetical protein
MNSSRWSGVIAFPALFEMEVKSGANTRRGTVSKLSSYFTIEVNAGDQSRERLKGTCGKGAQPRVAVLLVVQQGIRRIIPHIYATSGLGGVAEWRSGGVAEWRSEEKGLRAPRQKASQAP